MSSEGKAGALGLLSGVIYTLIAIALASDVKHEACAREHNVFECERVWVPVTGETPND